MKKENRSITVLGAGSMGTTLARLYQRKGYHVFLWNRTIAKAETLKEERIAVTADLVTALDAADVILVCVLDYAATNEILAAPGALETLKGKMLMQLSTGSPKEARELNAKLGLAGTGLLAAALQVAPEQMGQADTMILLSGEEALYQNQKALLEVMGGGIQYLGDDIGLASAMDLATLSTIYGALTGFLQGAAISAASGFDVATYGAIVAGIMPSYAGFLQHEATVIQSGDFSISQSPLSISVPATRRILEASAELGINTEFAALASGLMERAASAGYDREEFAAAVKLFYNPLVPTV